MKAFPSIPRVKRGKYDAIGTGRSNDGRARAVRIYGIRCADAAEIGVLATGLNRPGLGLRSGRREKQQSKPSDRSHAQYVISGGSHDGKILCGEDFPSL